MIRTCRKIRPQILRKGRFSSASDAAPFDVLVSGGGVVGAAFVSNFLRLVGASSDKLRIGIVDTRAPPTLESCLAREHPDLRVYALSPHSISLLQDIGAWKYIEEAGRRHSYDKMQVWDSAGPGLVTFDSKDNNSHELGCLAEDSTIQAAIFQSIKDRGHNVEFLFGHSVTGLEVEKVSPHAYKPAEVTLSPFPPSKDKDKSNNSSNNNNNMVVQARLVVGADGGMSPVRKLANISTWGWGYAQEGVVATVKTKEVHRTAWQRYLRTGPLALLPLWPVSSTTTTTTTTTADADEDEDEDSIKSTGESAGEKEAKGEGYSSIVWSVPVSEAQRLKQLPPDEFLEELNRALQAQSETDKWSVLNPQDALFRGLGLNQTDADTDTDKGTHTPFFLKMMEGRSLLPLSAVKREIAQLADAVMSASSLAGPPARIPPTVTSIVSPRVSFPLQLQQARTYAARRVALIGDAAHSIHPQVSRLVSEDGLFDNAM